MCFLYLIKVYKNVAGEDREKEILEYPIKTVILALPPSAYMTT